MTGAEKVVVVSSDCHAGASVSGYRPYLASRWHEEFDAWAATYHDAWLDADPGVTGRAVGAASGALTANWDSGERLGDLEADGIAAEVVFPNTSPPFFPSGNLSAPVPATREDYERRWAGLQAHNRWLVDFCSLVPGRRAGVAQVFLNDVDDAVREIRWAAEAGLTGGILLPGVSPGSGLPSLYSPCYEPVWAACEEAGVVINTHSGATGRPVNPGPGLAATAVASFESRWFANRALWHLIFAGVFERFPRLRLVMTEQGTAWVADRLKSADALCRAARVHGAPWRAFAGEAMDRLSMLPSEYFARNCYIGASQLLPAEVWRLDEIGADRVMWGSDYPHSEGSFPYTREALRVTFAGVPEAEIRMMLGQTAARVYGFDWGLLESVAAAIGPAAAEIMQPLAPDQWPSVPGQTVAHIFMPGMAPL
jgi:predicted TIM-barrel fold metal-dependent hydrolase